MEVFHIVFHIVDYAIFFRFHSVVNYLPALKKRLKKQ